MAQQDIIKFQDEFPDAENRYSFGGTTYGYAVLGNRTKKILFIIGSGAPSTNYNNAPYGSAYVDFATGKWYFKTGATSWTIAGSCT